MPNDFLVQLAQAYIAQPLIQIGYNIIRGGLGTVVAIVIEQPTLIAQAKHSIRKRNLLEEKSSFIHCKVG